MTLAALEIPRHDLYVVKEETAIRDLSVLFRATPVETWRAYMTFRYLNGMADVLPAAFDDLSFDFNGRVLSGQPQKRERWKRATAALNSALGEAVGQALEVRAGDPVGNRKRALLWDWKRRIARLGEPTDRNEWGMTPQNVNAYSNSFFNEIVFPAAILQPPYFDPAADPAVNYGGVGGVIGHEMSHAFDERCSARLVGRGRRRSLQGNDLTPCRAIFAL